MNKSSVDLRNHPTEIILREKINDNSNKETRKEVQKKPKTLPHLQKEFNDIINEDEKYRKVQDLCHYAGKFRLAVHSICNPRHEIPKEIPVVFHNDLNYDYHFIIKEIAEESKRKFECVGENTEKYVTFSVLKQKGNKNGKTVIYKIKFIDRTRFVWLVHCQL